MRPIPYLLGDPRTSPTLVRRAHEAGVRVIDVLDPSTESFQRLLGAANGHAFGSLGMPPWVQFDCATLPTVFTGFAATHDALGADAQGVAYLKALHAKDAELRPGQARLNPAGHRDAGADLVPLSGFCAARTEASDTVVAFSLFATGPVPRLGARSKALGLGLHGASRQVGVTQFGNPAVRVHARFGALEIVSPRAIGHSRPDETFVYAASGLDPAVLLTWGLEGTLPAPRYTDAQLADATLCELAVTDDTQAELVALAEKHGSLAILPPGTTGKAGRRMLRVGRAEALDPA